MSNQKLKPYFVEYIVTAVVMAEDDDDAWQVARSERREVFLDSCEVDIAVQGEIKNTTDLRDGWDMECIPYGGDGKTRIGELITAKDAA